MIKESRNVTTSCSSPQRPTPVGAYIIVLTINDDTSVFRIYLVSLAVSAFFCSSVFGVRTALILIVGGSFLFVSFKFSESLFFT